MLKQSIEMATHFAIVLIVPNAQLALLVNVSNVLLTGFYKIRLVFNPARLVHMELMRLGNVSPAWIIASYAQMQHFAHNAPRVTISPSASIASALSRGFLCTGRWPIFQDLTPI